MNTNRAILTIFFETGYDLLSEKDDIDLVELEDIILILNGKSNSFDWKEIDRAESWESMMSGKGYIVRDMDEGSDTLILVAIPEDKLKLIEFVANYTNNSLQPIEW